MAHQVEASSSFSSSFSSSSNLTIQHIYLLSQKYQSNSHDMGNDGMKTFNVDDEYNLWKYLVQYYSHTDHSLISSTNLPIMELNSIDVTSPQMEDPEAEERKIFELHLSTLILYILSNYYQHEHNHIHEMIPTSMLMKFLKSFLPIVFMLTKAKDLEIDMSEDTHQTNITIHQIILKCGLYIIRSIMSHSKNLLQEIFIDPPLIQEIFQFLNSYRISFTSYLIDPCCIYPPIHFSNEVVKCLLKYRIFEKLLSSLESISNGDDGSKVLEILACVVSSCLSAGDCHMKPYEAIQSGSREDILSIICSFEVNGILLNVAKLCSQFPQAMNGVYDRTIHSLFYLTLCKDPSVCYPRIAETLQCLAVTNLDAILSHYDYLSMNKAKLSMREFKECTEVVQVFIDIIPRIMGLRSNAKRKSLSGIESSQSGMENQLTITSRNYLVSYLRILSTLVAGHVEVRGRSLAKRLPLGSIAYSSLDDFDIVLFDEFCRSMAISVLACLPSLSAAESGKHLDPQLIHVCMHSGSLLSRHPELAPSYLFLATSVLLTKDPQRFRILFEAKVLDFCMVILTTPTLSHDQERGSYSVSARATFQFLSTLIICYPTFIAALVLDPRFQVFLFNSIYQFLTSSQQGINDFCCLLQFWLTFFLASDTYMYSTSKHNTSEEECLQNEHKITESLMHLIWIIFAALSGYPKKSSFGPVEDHDCCFILTVRILRIVLSHLESRGRPWSTSLLKTTISSAASTVRLWLEESPQSEQASKITDLLRNTQWILPPDAMLSHVSFTGSDQLESFLTTITSYVHHTVSDFSPCQAPSWVRSMPLSILVGTLMEYAYELFHFSYVTNSPNDLHLSFIRVTVREVVQLSLSFSCSSLTLPSTSRQADTANMEFFFSKNFSFLFEIDWDSPLLPSILNSKLDWYQHLYTTCVVVNSQISCPELFVRWVELAITSILRAMNPESGISYGEDFLFKWIDMLSQILDDILEWSQMGNSIALTLASSNLSLSLLHAHTQLFCGTNNLLHEVLFPEELGNVSFSISEKILNVISCLCGLYMSCDTLMCILDIMNSTVSIPSGEHVLNLSSDSLSQTIPSRSVSLDIFEKRSTYYGLHSEMIRKWGYSVILAAPDPVSQTQLSKAEPSKSFLVRMKTLELPSALHSPRKVSREHQRVQLKEHLASPAWCHIRLSNSSTENERIAMVTAKDALSECHDLSDSPNSSVGEGSWIPTSHGYTLSFWFSIQGDRSSNSENCCTTEVRCNHHPHFILCRIEGSENAYWPALIVYVCSGHVLISIQNQDKNILFEPLHEINYDGRWHHLVIRHHTNRSRPFIMATLDGLPSQEYSFEITPQRKTSKKNHRYSISSFITIPDGHLPFQCQLSLGPLMLIRRPLNTAQVIALFGAGPHYTSIFVKIMTQLPGGEGGEIPLNMSYCSNVLAEASLRAHSTKLKYDRLRSLNSLPGVMHGSIFTDPDLCPENVLFAASSKWTSPSIHVVHFPLSQDLSQVPKFLLTGREMLSDVRTFFHLLQRIRQNVNGSKEASCHSELFVYTPTSAHSSSLSLQGDIILVHRTSPSLSDNSAQVFDVAALFQSSLQLLLTSTGSQEVEYSIRLFIFLLTTFPSMSIECSNELYIHTLIDLIRQKIELGYGIGHFTPLLSLIAACPSKIQKSNNMKVLWYGSSGDENQDDAEVVQLDSADNYIDGILTNREVMLTSDAILIHPNILRRVFQLILFPTNTNVQDLDRLLNKVLTSQLHPISRFTQINRFQFVSSNGLGHILCSLTFPKLSSEKIITTSDFLMKLIESDIGIFEDYQAIFNLLLIICTHSKSISMRFLSLYNFEGNTVDQLPFQVLSALNEEDNLDECMHEYSLLRQSLLLLLLQAVNGFYATATACRKDGEVDVSDKKEPHSLGNDRDILLSVLKDTGGKSLETVVAAVPLSQLLYLMNRTLGLTLLHSREKATLSRLVLLNPKSIQDYKAAVLCLLIFSCVVQVNFSAGEISASALQQAIIELELYLPPLFFAVIFSSTMEGDKREDNRSPSTVGKVPPLTFGSGPSSTPVRLTSIIYGNSFVELDGLERNANSSPNLKAKQSASSVLSNIKSTYQYFSSYKAGIAAIEERESGYWLSKFVEGVFDIAMGAPGTLKQNLADLLVGWSLSELEPKYNIPTPLPDLNFEPSPHGMCVGLSALMNVIVDASRFSTACSLMFLSTLVAVDEAAPENDKSQIPSAYLRSWTENELAQASNRARSTSLSLLCCLFSLLQRSPVFRKFLFQPSPTKTHWAAQTNPDKKRNKKFQRYTLMDVLMLGLVHTYFAASKARLMECLGSRSKIEDGLASFEAGVQVPYEFIYVCTLTSIGSLAVQMLVFLTTSEFFEINTSEPPTDSDAPVISSLSNLEKEHIISSLEAALLTPDEVTFPQMPKSALKAIHHTLNATLRRKVLQHYYQIVQSEASEDLTTYTSPVTANKRFYIRGKIAKLSTLLVEIVRFELDLSSLCSGSILEYLESRIFEPVSMLMDITTFACAPLRLPTAVSSSEPSEPSKTPSNPKPFGWGTLVTNVKSQFTAEDQTPSAKNSASFVPPRVLIGGFFKKNFANLLGTSESLEDSDLPEQKENLMVIQCLTTSLMAIRSSSILLLERLREKSQLRKEVLLFLMKYKYYFFRLLPREEKPNKKSSKGLLAADKSPKVERDLDLEYTGCLSFYFYQCMHDEDIELRTLAMKSWGEVFRSELSQYANELLVVQVNNDSSSEILLQMKIDLWKIDRGGMYLLENLAWSPSSDTTTKAGESSIDTKNETYAAFSKWLDELPEEIRDAFESQISNTADRLRQEVMSNRSKAIRNRKEKWELFSNQRAAYAKELYEYLAQLFIVKKREARAIQREQLSAMKSRIREWIMESTYSSALTKDLLYRSRNNLLFCSRVGKTVVRCHTLSTLPPLLTGRYVSFSKWNENNLDEKSDSTPYFLESSEVSPGSGEWALELTEGYYRMRRKIRRGNLVLAPIYFTAGDVNREPSGVVNPPPQNQSSMSNHVETLDHLDTTTSPEQVEGIPQNEISESDSSDDEIPDPSWLNVSSEPINHAEMEESDAQETAGFSSLPEIPKVPLKVARKMKRVQLRQERLAHADNDPLAAFVNDIDSHSLITLPDDSLIFKCVGQQVMGMDSQKVVCGISEKNYFYIFDCASSAIKSAAKKLPDSETFPNDPLRQTFIRQRQSSFGLNDESLELPSGTFHADWSTIGGGGSIGSRTRYWKLSNIYSVQYRRYLLLPKALEIFFLGGKSLFIRFQSPTVASSLLSHISSQCSHIPLHGGVNGSMFQNLSTHGSLPKKQPRIKESIRSTVHSIEDAIKCCLERWVNGEMSNFEYLMHLNTFSGRTYNDWGQYPIFPWVLQDYFSEELDFENPMTFRDLSKPMGALTALRREEAMDKFHTLQQQFESQREHWSGSRDVNTFLTEAASRPFHYGTHYSTAAIVLHYMIRLQPFASHAVVFQGDKFDHPDRLFQSIRHSWMSSSGGISEDPSTLTSNLQDVKELIPEFFYLPDFLCNVNGYNFGVTSNGAPVNNIELPPWAHGSPQLFIIRHRAALESEFVSRNLHKWIDLIFGYKQTGEEAVKSCNLYRYLTYGNNLDIVDLQNETQRSAFADEICSFGQTPNQLFKKRHPPRRIWNGRDISPPSDPPESLSPSNSVEAFNIAGKPRDDSGLTYSVGDTTSVQHLVLLKTPPIDVGTTKTMQTHLWKCLPSSPIIENMSLSTGKDIVSIVSSANEMIFIPRNCLLLPSKGKFHLLLAFGDLEATFRVLACSIQATSSRRSVSPTEQLSPANIDKPNSQPESNNLMLRGFEPRERTSSTGTRSASIESGLPPPILPPKVSVREPSEAVDRRTAKRTSETQSSRTTSSLEPEIEVWNQNWKLITSFDYPEITISCASFGGISGEKLIVLTGHRTAPVIHMWAIDVSALQSAAFDVFSLPHTSVPSAVHAFVLVHSFHNNIHFGGITNLSVCLKWDHLHGYAGMFASTCETRRVVMWDYCYSDDIYSVQPISRDQSGVEIYPLEESPQIQYLNDMSFPTLETITHLTFDSIVGDLFLCIGQRVLIFDVNGRLKSAAQPSLYTKHSILSSEGALALCCQSIYCTEWESSRGFLVGYSDGSIVLWALRHYRDIPNSLLKSKPITTIISENKQTSGFTEMAELTCLQESCLPSPSIPSDKPTDMNVDRKKFVSSEDYLHQILNSCTTYAESYEEWYLKSWSTNSAPTYQISYHHQNEIQASTRHGNISTEYICCPVLCLHKTVCDSIPITSVRLSSDWEYIVAGRSDGTVVKWKIREEKNK